MASTPHTVTLITHLQHLVNTADKIYEIAVRENQLLSGQSAVSSADTGLVMAKVGDCRLAARQALLMARGLEGRPI